MPDFGHQAFSNSESDVSDLNSFFHATERPALSSGQFSRTLGDSTQVRIEYLGFSYGTKKRKSLTDRLYILSITLRYSDLGLIS
jgi:hypothetical protein